MVMGVARASLAAAKVFKFTISTNQINANLRTLANAAGYSGYGHVEATINSGIDCYASNTSNYGLTVGTFPAGSIVTLNNNGYISGAGGAGGTGGTGRDGNGYLWIIAAQGSTGGNALNANAVSGFTFKLNNAAGTIRAGGGGGGGGGQAGYEYDQEVLPRAVVWPGGGGGGGGQGNVGGTGGSQYGFEDYANVGYYDGAPYTLGPGNNGTALGAGAGGPGGYVNFIPQCYAGNGGNGGTWGQAGSPGLSGVSSVPDVDNYSFSGAAGGSPGYSIVGYSKISIIAAGTLQGVTNG